MTDASDSQVSRLEQERDLYLGLLDLNVETDREAFVVRALALITSVVGAKQGYIELFSSDGNEASWYHATGFSGDEVERIRTLVSRGVIAHAVATGNVVRTPAAFLDPRFRDRESVQRTKLDAVLCAPIGTDLPVGVLYLQGQAQSRTFGDEEARQIERFARLLAPIAGDRFLERTEPHGDPTLPYRRRMKLEGLVGKSSALAELFQELELVARLNVGVLICGETGTGKSQVAHAIHTNSPRESSPFVALNCAAIPENLLESELFGARKGAHSTATRDLEGKVAAAHGGTLLLDEIGELPITAQAKLLQFLQSKEYFVLGDSHPEESGRAHHRCYERQPHRSRPGASLPGGPALPSQCRDDSGSELERAAQRPAGPRPILLRESRSRPTACRASSCLLRRCVRSEPPNGAATSASSRTQWR